jgi:hypothetical protein
MSLSTVIVAINARLIRYNGRKNGALLVARRSSLEGEHGRGKENAK